MPYANAITRAVSAVASAVRDRPSADHRAGADPPGRRAGDHLRPWPGRVVLRATCSSRPRRCTELLHGEGKEVKTYLVGRKAQAYFDFRNIAVRGRCGPAARTPRSSRPPGKSARHCSPTSDAVRRGRRRRDPRRLHPLQVHGDPGADGHPSAAAGGCRRGGRRPRSELLPLYEFEPEPEQVLDALLPRYIESRIFAAMLQAAASRACSPPAGDEVRRRQRHGTHQEVHASAQHARQAEITQELSEIVRCRRVDASWPARSGPALPAAKANLNPRHQTE